MMTRLKNRMHRHTRPAEYVSESCRKQQMYANRPGSNGFSFSGEFPAWNAYQPVEAYRSSRCHTEPRAQGAYRPVMHTDTQRMPAVCRHGVRGGAALMMFMALFVCLALVVGCSLSEYRQASNAISAARENISKKTAACTVLETDIAAQSGDLNIRKEALLMGMVSPKGAQVNYLEVPEDAVLAFSGDATILSLASIWGQ